MEIKVKGSTMVKPLTAKPSTTLWLSDLVVIIPLNYHTNVCYFYRPTGGGDFFDATRLKEALGRALVEFYPVAGRLNQDGDDDRVEINCNGEGALFVEADADGTLDDLGDFGPGPGLCFIPPVDYSLGISTFPLLLVQVTRFKCGGVCLGTAVHHYLADATSGFHFSNTWAEIARGVDISIRPYLERCEVLSPRIPPRVQFKHSEYHPPPTLRTPRDNCECRLSTFKLTRDQLKALREEHCAGGCSTYAAVAAHLWRCVTEARALPEDQETKLYIPVDGRQRMRPPLPRAYFGNVIFQAPCSALCGELVSNPLKFAADRIKEAIARMDDEYLRSALDYLKVEGAVDPRARGVTPFNCPNMGINSWAKFPIYDADFGWGKPVHVGFCSYLPEGMAFVFPTPIDDGSLLLGIALPNQEMQVFQKLFKDI